MMPPRCGCAGPNHYPDCPQAIGKEGSATRAEVEAMLGPDPIALYAYPKELLIRLGTFPSCWSALHPNRRVWMTLDADGAVVCPVCEDRARRHREHFCNCGRACSGPQECR